MLREIFGLLLLIVSCIHILGVNNRKIIFSTKPLLMPLIILYYSVENVNINWLIVAGLTFGLLGDVFLMLPKEKKQYFMLGLVAFLVGHLFYVAAFISTTISYPLPNPAVITPWWFKLLFIIPYALLAMVLISKLKPDLGKLLIPTTVYMIVILFMSFSALWMAITISEPAIWITYSGTVLFVCSDSILAWDKFHREIKNGRVYVMFTYILGQFLIASGFL